MVIPKVVYQVVQITQLLIIVIKLLGHMWKDININERIAHIYGKQFKYSCERLHTFMKEVTNWMFKGSISFIKFLQHLTVKNIS